MIKIFWILTSVSFKYSQADWLELEYILSKKKTLLLLKKEKQQMSL